MRRREFISLVGTTAATWPFAACNDCYPHYMRRWLRKDIWHLAIIAGIILLVGSLYFSAEKENERTGSKSLSHSSAGTTLPNQTANIVRTSVANKSRNPADTAIPADVQKAQDRLIELGFLPGAADGSWGTKSRTALRAFKPDRPNQPWPA